MAKAMTKATPLMCQIWLDADGVIQMANGDLNGAPCQVARGTRLHNELKRLIEARTERK